jgi:triosephosphate isomerase
MVAGNWKMNKTVPESLELVSQLDMKVSGVEGVDVLVCPPYVALEAVAKELDGSSIEVGAQNMHWEESGAFTGEISPLMLEGLCSHVIIGHSERRTLFGETDKMVNQRIKTALAHGFTPILCVGETLEENEAGQTADVISRQVRQGLADISQAQAEALILAYEPVWAIGTGRAASADGANDVIAVIIRPALEHLFGQEVADQTRVLYGGSIKPNNAAELFAQPDIDGGLVGGASLKADDFAAIIKAAV